VLVLALVRGVLGDPARRHDYCHLKKCRRGDSARSSSTSSWRTTGDHNDFSVELPIDVDTTATSSVYVASVSFSNTFETITAGVNDRLFILSRTLGNLPSANIVAVSPGRYTGATLAAEIQSKLRAASLNNSYTAAFDEAYGTITISDSGRLIQLPSEGELRSSEWKGANWDPYKTVYDYSVPDPASLNSILFFPRPSAFANSVTSGNIDLGALIARSTSTQI
jgi:hypothetical protein